MKILQRKIDEAVRKANFDLRRDVFSLIKKAYKSERSQKARLALSWIIENIKIARRENLAICQDTGLPLGFIEVGRDSRLSFSFIKAVKRAIESSYQKNYLRASLVKPLSRGEPSYRGVPIYVDFNPKVKNLGIIIFSKGFGSENKSQLKMFTPTASLEEIEDFIIKVVKGAGPEACPPFVVGVGIGGSSDSCLLLAKKALIERIDKPNKDKFLASLEKRLLRRINSLNIGPMGLGGRTTALAVKIKSAPTHIAGLPVGVNVSCWALRTARIDI